MVKTYVWKNSEEELNKIDLKRERGANADVGWDRCVLDIVKRIKEDNKREVRKITDQNEGTNKELKSDIEELKNLVKALIEKK